MRSIYILVGLLASALLTGCADASYYFQSMRGHLQMMRTAQPVEQWLADESVAPAPATRSLTVKWVK